VTLADRRDLERARHLIELRRLPEALDLLAALRADDPGDRDVHALTAACHLGLGRLPEALAAGNEVVRVAPDDEWGHRICAMVLDRMGRHDEAVRAAGTAVTLAPLDWRTHETYAAAAVDARFLGREARAAAERAVELGPNEPSCHFVLGLVAQRFKDDDTARAAYRRTLALDPQHAMAMNNLAVLDGGLRLGALATRFGAALRHEPGSQTVLGNVDWLAARFVRRLYVAALVAFLVGLVAAVAGSGDELEGAFGPTVWSVLVGVALAVGITAYTWTLGRAIPVGVRRYVRERMVRDRFLLANVVLTTVMALVALVVCFVPGGAAVGLVALRPIGFANIAIVVWGVTRRG
jgi:Flp pilus assembly protein TadD